MVAVVRMGRRAADDAAAGAGRWPAWAGVLWPMLAGILHAYSFSLDLSLRRRGSDVVGGGKIGLRLRLLRAPHHEAVMVGTSLFF